jgi:hypothetical protein
MILSISEDVQRFYANSTSFYLRDCAPTDFGNCREPTPAPTDTEGSDDWKL